MFKSLTKLQKPFVSMSQSFPKFAFGTTNSPFFVQQFNTACLAEFAYYVESNGEAAIIDPLREVKSYIDFAKSRNAKIKYVFETHFHADFVSGHLNLAKETGAKIIYGPGASAEFDLYSAKDGEVFNLGEIALKVLHTPGHTMESSCFLLSDKDKKPHCVFTGDTLFLGEVGRPDLAVASDLTKEDLASYLYDSLREKILPLPDDVIVYPGHGAGSSCGKNISAGTSCTIGQQKKSNYALQPMTKQDFVHLIADDLPPPPKYFFLDAKLNKTNITNLETVVKRNMQPLSVQEAKDAVSKGALILDSRTVQNCYATGIIPGSINISLTTPFAIWVGTLLDHKNDLIVLTEPGKEEETIMRLARVGYDNCKGYIKGGIEEWVKNKQPVEKMPVIDCHTHYKEAKEDQEIKVLDVRNPPEWTTQGVYHGSQRIPLRDLEKRVQELNKEDDIHLLCKTGVRSTMAFTLLRRLGFEHLTIIRGGADEVIESGYKLDEFKE